MIDADYVDDLAHLANIQAKAESLLHSIEQAIGGIRLCVNVNKTECMCFTRKGAISIRSGKPLKLMDQLTSHLLKVMPRYT